MRNVGVKENDVVIDFGCWKGFYSVAAANVVGEKGKVYAIDKKIAVFSISKRFLKNGLKNIELKKTKGEIAFDINEGRADVVLLYDVLHMFSLIQRKELITNLHKLLKEDGLLSVHPCHINEYKVIRNSKKYTINELIKDIEYIGFKYLHKTE